MQLPNFVRLPTKFINGCKLARKLGERGESIYRKMNIFPHLSQIHSSIIMKYMQLFKKCDVSSQTPLWFTFKAGHCITPAATRLVKLEAGLWLWSGLPKLCDEFLPSQVTHLWEMQCLVPTGVGISHLPTLKGSLHITTEFSSTPSITLF